MSMLAQAGTTTIYRCETADGISLQSRPCPKGVQQTKRIIQRPAETVPPSQPTAPVVSTAASAVPNQAPVTAATDLHSPNDPYPLWECMRADGSTFDSRNGIPGKQWVVNKTDVTDTDPASIASPAPAQITAVPKGPIVRPYVEADVAQDAPAIDPTPPPPGAAAGAWIADQCTQMEAQKACERFAGRRDALRKQIYAAMPSERIKYAPEEQDLTRMLYAACQR